MCVYSVVSDYFATPWITAHQALLSIGFSRQEYLSGLPFPSPGDLPNPGIEPVSLASPALAGRFFTTGTTWEAIYIYMYTYIYIHTYTHTHTTHTHTYICISKHILFGRAGIFPYLVDEETEVWQGWLCAQVMFLAHCEAGPYTKLFLFQSQLTLPSLFTVEQKY